MSRKLSKTSALVLILIGFFYLFPYSLSQEVCLSYQFLDQSDGNVFYRLNVTVPQTLLRYYRDKSHNLNSVDDFAKFVTPFTFEPVANILQEIYSNDESFVNGALMLVHQIPYKETAPSKYPVETIIENQGDCDLFSFIAASIIKAGGLDVVLLYYDGEAHMNVGVSLSSPPSDVRSQVHYVTYNEVRYYVAECTGGEWNDGWRVGECPDSLKQASVQVITLENCEQEAPEQVSASYCPLTTSTLSLAVSPTFLLQGGTVTILGQLSPQCSKQNITIYITTNNSPWRILDTATTDSEGKFVYILAPETAGFLHFKVMWAGNNEYTEAESPIQTVTVLSTFFILLLTVTIILAALGIIIFLMSRHTTREISEPQPPEPPTL